MGVHVYCVNKVNNGMIVVCTKLFMTTGKINGLGFFINFTLNISNKI